MRQNHSELQGVELNHVINRAKEIMDQRIYNNAPAEFSPEDRG